MKAKPSDPVDPKDATATSKRAEAPADPPAGTVDESPDEQMKRKYREAMERKHGSSSSAKQGHGDSAGAGHLAAGGPAHRMFRRKAGG